MPLGSRTAKATRRRVQSLMAPLDHGLPMSPEQDLTLRVFPDIQRQAFACLLRLERRDDLHQALIGALGELVSRHDAFRVFFTQARGRWEQRLASDVPEVVLERADTLEGLVARPDLNMDRAPLMRAVYITDTTDDYLYLALHHMVFDGLSLHILLGELDALLRGRRPRRPAPSFAGWLDRLAEVRDVDWINETRRSWESQLEAGEPLVPSVRGDGPNRLEFTQNVSVRLELYTAREAVRSHRPAVRPDVLALTVLLQAMRATIGNDRFHLCLTHNGRTEDTSTMSTAAGLVGLIVTHYYTVLDVPEASVPLPAAYKHVLHQLDELPAPSSFGLVYQRTAPEARGVLHRLADPFATYTYHSSKTGGLYQGSSFAEVKLPPGVPRTGERTPDFSLIVESDDPYECRATIVYGQHQYERSQIQAWLDLARRITLNPYGDVVGAR